MAGIMGALMLITAMITVFTVKEPARAKSEASEQLGFFGTFSAALRNKPFLLTLSTYALHICGTSIVQGSLIYYFKYIYGPGASLELALALLLLPVIPSIWVWTTLSRKIGKKLCWNLGMGLVAVACLAVFLFARQGGPAVFYIIMAVAGIGLSTNYVMPYAVMPDTVELDYAENGVRREGAFYGVFNFMNKAGVAVANLINGLVLSAVGYVANVPQTEGAKLGIQFLVGPIAMVFFAAGVVTFAFYPISRKFYETVIMPKVAARDAMLK
jgi:GPH family glycoside/pentoside/hexuronide:cation symporter